MDESSKQEQEMTPLVADKGKESDIWLPSVLPPGQEMKDYLPKTDPVGFQIPQTENWDEDSGGVSNGVATVAPESSTTSHSVTMQASDTRDSNALPGVCGLVNMGNTCYMNAGLQCVYNIPGFCQHFFSVHDMEGKKENSPEWMRQQLEIQLSLLIRKYWCGQYQALHPKLFKQVLGVVHPQLNGFRQVVMDTVGYIVQQDCQEFLALLLGSLQDNHTPSKASHEPPSSRQRGANVSRPDEDALSQQHEDDVLPQQQSDVMVAPSSHDDTTETTATHNVSSDVSLSPPQGDNDTAMEVSSSEEPKTTSLDIVKEFQGILHNEVLCDVCNYMSTKEEPFLFLSLPLPHANERQIKIIWMPLSSRDNQCMPTRVLVTVIRNVTVAMVKEELLSVLQLNDTLSTGSVILSEVSSHYIHRVLSNDLAVKTIDDTKYDLYAFEMLTVSETTVSHDLPAGSHDQSIDQLSGSHNQPGESHEQQEVSMATHGESTSVTSVDTDNNSQPHPLAAGCSNGSGCSNDAGQGSPPAKLMKSEPITIVSEWHCCAICLEELLDTELKGHSKCGASICDTCLQASRAHYSDKPMQCPVCTEAVDFDKDFVPLATGGTNQSNVIRLLQTNVMFRLVDLDGSIKRFGHPHIFYLPTPTSGHDLYHTIQQFIPTLVGWGDMLNLHLTDSTACHCSRCDYIVKCSGCLISAEAPEVLLKPGDHVTITCHKQQYDEVLDTVSMVTEHVSMATQWDPVLRLQDCLQTFSQKEQLASDNLWYCSRCQANQPVTRVLSIQKLPGTLIIHLKRFVFYGSEAIKVDTAVNFPMEFKASDIHHGNADDCNEDCTFKLVAAVCHFGVMGCGHYTAYTYNTISNQWHYFNDETVTQKQPDSDTDSSYVYLLFYQSDISAASLLPKMVDLENCLQEERLSSEKLSKLFEAPSVTLSSPVLKKSHSDGNLAAQNKPEVGMTTSLLNTMDLATSKGFERTTSLLDDYSNYDFDYEDTGGHVIGCVMAQSAKPLPIPDYLS